VLVCFGYFGEVNFLSSELYDELTIPWALIYIYLLVTGLYGLPVIVFSAYFFLLFFQARRVDSRLGLAGTLLGCLFAPLITPGATLAAIKLHEVLASWPEVVEKFNPSKAKLTVDSACYSPDGTALRVAASVVNTTGRDLVIYSASIGVTQNIIVQGDEIWAAPEAEIRYLPKRDTFLLHSDTAVMEILLAKGERAQVKFAYSTSELEAALRGPPEKGGLFYCPVEFTYWYLNH
jgi:hypothetical protein